jgi:biuret amidohydrolase
MSNSGQTTTRTNWAVDEEEVISMSQGSDDWFIDRSPMIAKLNEHLHLDPRRSALVAVDLLRGHLDPEIATLPLPPDTAERVIRANERLFALCRSVKMPIVHVVQVQRRHPTPSADVLSNPFWAAVHAVGETLTPGMSTSLERHNLEGSPQAEVVGELAPREDEHVVIKKRLTGFHATDLELLLRSLGVDTTIITGINTNTCITGTAFEAMHRDFKVVVLGDCVASGHGEDLHRFALQNFARCVGWVLTTDELATKLGATVELAV